MRLSLCARERGNDRVLTLKLNLGHFQASNVLELSCPNKHNQVRFGLKVQACAGFMGPASFVVQEQRDIDFFKLILYLNILDQSGFHVL